MAATIPSLWPDINVDLVPPVTILRAQATRLGQLTKGILEAEVTTVTGDKDFTMHRLDLIAPALDGRRVRVLTATHREDYYPLVLEAACFRPTTANMLEVRKQAMEMLGSSLSGIDLRTQAPMREWPPPNDWRPVAANQDDFLRLVGEVLKSMEVRSAIDSLIALSNQKQQPSEGGEQGNTGTAESPPSDEETRP